MKNNNDQLANNNNNQSSLQATKDVEAAGDGYAASNSMERHGPLRRAVPCMPYSVAMWCALCNVLLPGLGTFFSAFASLCCGVSEYENHFKAFGLNLLTALLQLLSAVFLVGIVWSILWAIIFVHLASRWWLRMEERDHTLSMLNLRI